MSLSVNNLLQLTGGAHGVGAVQHSPQVQTGGVVDPTETTTVNLENKTGTSNQAVHLPGDRITYTARNLDFSA